MFEVPGIATPEVQQEFRSRHQAWCNSEGWRWKAGARVPSLDRFIVNKTWKYAPPAEQKPMSKADEMFDRLIQKARTGTETYDKQKTYNRILPFEDAASSEPRLFPNRRRALGPSV